MRRAFRAFACAVACSRRCAPLPRRRRRTASSPRSPTAAWSRSTPTAAGCARCRCRTRARSPSSRGRPDGNRLAFVTAGEISVLELATGRVVALTAGARDANPAWSADGTRSGSGAAWRSFRVAGGGRRRRSRAAQLLGRLTTEIAWAPDLHGRHAPSSPALLVLAGPRPAAGRRPALPAWAPDGSAARVRRRRRAVDDRAAAARPSRSLDGAAPGSPRWSPDSTRARLSPPAARCARVTLATGAPRRSRSPGVERVGPVDWQPCVAGVTLSCESVAPPRCSAPAATATTQADQPVDLPGAAVHRPGGAPAVARRRQGAGPRHALRPALHAGAPASRARTRSTYRVSNGVAESETLPRHGLRRPAPVPAPRRPGHAGRRCSCRRAVPERARDAAAGPQAARRWCRLSCDQDCSLAVRLTGDAAHRASTLARPAGEALDRGRAACCAAAAAAGQAARDAEDGLDHRPRAQRGRRGPQREAAGQAAALTISSSSASMSLGVVCGFSSVSLSATAPLTRVRPITARAGREQVAVDADVGRRRRRGGGRRP